MLRSVETQPLTGRFVFVRFQNLKNSPKSGELSGFLAKSKITPLPPPGERRGAADMRVCRSDSSRQALGKVDPPARQTSTLDSRSPPAA
jgi:hypothetical protein